MNRALIGFSAALTLLCAPLLIVFAQVDVPRRTTAITYPLDEVVMVQFRGTTRFPRMKGEAKVRRTSRNGTQVELSVSKMPRPFELGAGYATYVLWAISPDGQVDNLGEIRRRGTFEFDSKINVTTPLQTFALLITAEPHFLVRRPSQAIMLENLSPVALSGNTIATTPSVQYFGNSSDYFRDARTPEIAEIDYSKTPSTILQAKQAVALARYAGADRDATAELTEAENLLKQAEDAWRAGRDEESVDITARSAVGTAVKAESTAVLRKDAREKRNERTRADAEVREIESKYAEAQNEIAELKSQLAAEIRQRELAERDAGNYSGQLRELRLENGRLRDELAAARSETNTVRTQLSNLESENRSMRSIQEQKDKAARIQAGEPALIAQLRRLGTVTRTERGIAITLPESFWASPRSSGFAPGADAKLNSLAEAVNANPDYSIVIESHTDSSGDAEQLRTMTAERASAIATRLTALGVNEARLQAAGLGASLPIAANTTAASRAKNRRVQVIFSP